MLFISYYKTQWSEQHGRTPQSNLDIVVGLSRQVYVPALTTVKSESWSEFVSYITG